MMVQYRIDHVDAKEKVIRMSEISQKEPLPSSAQFSAEEADRKEFEEQVREIVRMREEFRKEQESPDYVPPVYDQDDLNFFERISTHF